MSKFLKFGMILLFVSACGISNSESTLSITNSRLAGPDEFQSVVKLRNLVNGRICAGTFIAVDMVLTTAHCVYGTRTDIGTGRNNSMVIVPDQNITSELSSVQVHAHPLWSEQIGYANIYDIAIVEFSGANIQEISPWESKPLKTGKQAQFVGFGDLQAQGQLSNPLGNAKRVGKNRIIEFSRSLISLYGTNKTTLTDGSASNSSAVSGDSGSPLFVEGELVGICIASGLVGNTSQYRSEFINLQSEHAIYFIKSILQ